MGSDIDKDTLFEIERITGAEFCSSGAVSVIDEIEVLRELRAGDGQSEGNRGGGIHDARTERIRLLETFPTNNHECIDMGRWSGNLISSHDQSLRKSFGFVELEGAKIPLIVTRLEEAEILSEERAGTIVVRVSGGPGGIPIRPLSDYTLRIGENDIIVDIFYTGSGVNLLYPSPSFGIASNQVKKFVSNLRKRNARAQIVVVGESLGAIIALSSFEGEGTGSGSQAMIDKVILLSPLAMSPGDFVELSAESARNLSSGELIQSYRTLEKAQDNWSSRSIVDLNRVDVLSRFFEYKEMKINIVERMKENNKEEVLIIYGADDMVIGVDILRKIKEREGVKLVEVVGMGHYTSSYSEVRQVGDAIDEFVGW